MLHDAPPRFSPTPSSLYMPHPPDSTSCTLHPTPHYARGIRRHMHGQHALSQAADAWPTCPILSVLLLPSCSLATPRAPLSLPLPAYTRMRTDERAETSRFPRHASWSRLWGWAVRFRQVRRRRGRVKTTVAPSALPAWILNKRPHLEHACFGARDS